MTESLFTRSQGIQLFFIRKILDEDHTMVTFFADEKIHDFFRQWSQIVRDNKNDEGFPLTINVPVDFLKHTDEPVEKEVDLIVLGEEITKHYTPTESKLDAVPEAYHPLLKDLKFAPFFPLLKDANLSQLMKIEYPADTTGIPARTESSPDEDIITEVIAKQRSLKTSEITADLLKNVKSLNLSGRKFTGLAPLQNLTNLQYLYLGNSNITDLTPLQNLTKLKQLWLSNTQVTDLTPLQNLTNLQILYLDGTQVTDLTPLQKLTSLKYLILAGGQVTNLAPLKKLSDLQLLHLTRTQVADLTPLQKLTNLQELYLNNTQVTDLAPLQKLTNLQELYLDNTQVTDLAPLLNLRSLAHLDISNTPAARDKDQINALQKALPKLKLKIRK